MSGRRGRTLAERSQSSTAPAAAAADAAVDAVTDAAARPRPISHRHCWVIGVPDHPGRWAGLLAEWRRGSAGWEGRVVYAVAVADRCVLVEAWLSAAQLQVA